MGENIQKLKERYKDEWLAIEITKEEAGIPLEGELVYHSMDRRKVWEKTKEKQRLYITYAGPPLKKGYVAAFLVLK